MNKLRPFKLTKENFFIDKYWGKALYHIGTQYIFKTKRQAEIIQERILDNQEIRQRLEKRIKEVSYEVSAGSTHTTDPRMNNKLFLQELKKILVNKTSKEGRNQ